MVNEETRNSKLLLGVETKGTDKAAKDIAGIGKTARQLDSDLKNIGKTNALANSFKEADRALDKLTTDIRNDLKGGLDEAARSAKDIGGGGSSGGGNAPAAAKFRGVASFVGGGEFVGVIDDIQDAVEGVGQLGGMLSGTLSPALAGGAAGMAAFALPLAAIAVVVAAVGLAVKNTIDQIHEQIARVGAELEAERSAVEAAFDGATISDATAQIEKYNNTIAAQTELLERNGDRAKARFDELVKAEEKATGPLADLTIRIRTLAGLNDVNTLNAQSDKSKEKRLEAEAGVKEWTEEIERGSFKADEAAQKEVALADARAETGSATSAAADAEKERVREVEKVQQEQSRAAEKAQQEAEQNAQKAADAQNKYNDAIANAGTQFKQASQDINTKLGQALTDNLSGMFRDVEDLTTKFHRDTFDQDMKANQAERDALSDHLRDIDDIREDARQSEQEAIQEGDFKALFLARRAGEDAFKQEQKETRREGEDRRRALGDERADLLRNATREREDRMMNYARQNADSQTAAQRELQAAQVARTRSLEAAANAYRSELQQLGQYLQQRNQMQAQANQQALNNMSNPRPGAGMIGNQAGIPPRMIKQVFIK